MNSKIKVLQFGRFFPPHIGGTENVIADLFNGLNEKGIETDVLCCNDSNNYEETAYSLGKVIKTKTIAKFGSIAISIQQILVLKKIWKQYDVIHVHHPAPMANLALWIIRPKCKILVYWHSDIVRQKIMLFFFRPLQNWLLKKAEIIVATTPKYIEHSRPLQLYPSKTCYVPIGISKLRITDYTLFNTLKKRFENKKIIFSLGRLVGYKGFRYLIDAAKYLDESYVILIGGSGPLKKDLTRQIHENNFEKRIFLLGRLSNEDLPVYFYLCDLYCMSSITKNEAFGLVLPEAMSFSKPIVATTIPGSGVQWVNENSVSGINVEIENPFEIAKAIKEILEDQDKRKIYGEGSLNRFNNLFEKKRMVNSFVELYVKMTSR